MLVSNHRWKTEKQSKNRNCVNDIP